MFASAMPPQTSSTSSGGFIASLAFESNQSSRELFPTCPNPARECIPKPMETPACATPDRRTEGRVARKRVPRRAPMFRGMLEDLARAYELIVTAQYHKG